MEKEKNNMIYNYNRLIGKIKEFYPNREDFAKELGISAASLNSKLNGVTQFKANEIELVVKILSLENVTDYFFIKNV